MTLSTRRRILITGGAGFIGCNLADALIRDGHTVMVFDNLSRRGADKNLTWLRERHGNRFTFVQGDIRSPDAINQAMAGVEVVYHLAGQTAVTTSVTKPREDFEANALGTFNVLEAARLFGDEPAFLYSSTNKVYGGMEDVPVVELATRYTYRDLAGGATEHQPLDFHSPYGCCYSADTDVLTRHGWRRFYELTPDDEVLTYNMDRRVAEFQRPTAHFVYPYQGKMYVQHNRRLQTCVTPNHKMLVAWDCNHNELERPRLVEAQLIAGKPMAYLLAAEVVDDKAEQQFILPEIKAGKYKHDFPAKSIAMYDWVRFLGWYLAEGHCYENAKTGNCTVTLTTKYRTQEATTVMRAIGLSPVVDHHHITATSRQLYEYVRGLGKSHDKFIPLSIKELNNTYLQTLLTALLDGDGSNKQSKNSWRYTTVSKQLADDVQEIAIRCGLAASQTLDKEGFYRVNICTTRTTQCNLGENKSEWIDYSGMVYCVEVPNSVVLVRQNGHAYFSGNSKGAADQYVRDYQRIYGLPTVVFRQSCIYGPRQMGVEDQGWVAWFLIATTLNRPITIFGNGKQVRDLLYVDDLVNAYKLAIEHIEKTAGQVYNIGGGPERTMSVWAEFRPILETVLGRPVPDAKYADWRPGDQPVFFVNISKAKHDFGWEPSVGVHEGIERLAQWVQANKTLFED